MKTKRLFVGMIVFVLFIILLAGCNGPTVEPDEVVNQYWEYISQGETEEAEKLIYPGRENNFFQYPEATEDVDDEMEKLIIEKLDIYAEGYEEVEDVAIVNLDITKPDIRQVMEGYLQEAMAEGFSMAMSGASDSEIEERMIELAVENFEKADTKNVSGQAELRLDENEWKLYDWNLDEIMEESFKEIEDDMMDMLF